MNRTMVGAPNSTSENTYIKSIKLDAKAHPACIVPANRLGERSPGWRYAERTRYGAARLICKTIWI
jgi:hypothetical protein